MALTNSKLDDVERRMLAEADDALDTIKAALEFAQQREQDMLYRATTFKQQAEVLGAELRTFQQHLECFKSSTRVARLASSGVTKLGDYLSC